MDPSKVERKGTGLAVIGLILIIAAVIAICAVFLLYPDIWSSVFVAVGVIIAVLLVLVLGIALVALVAAPYFYMKRGVETQVDMEYDLDDVKPVEGKIQSDKE